MAWQNIALEAIRWSGRIGLAAVGAYTVTSVVKELGEQKLKRQMIAAAIIEKLSGDKVELYLKWEELDNRLQTELWRTTLNEIGSIISKLTGFPVSELGKLRNEDVGKHVANEVKKQKRQYGV